MAEVQIDDQHQKVVSAEDIEEELVSHANSCVQKGNVEELAGLISNLKTSKWIEELPRAKVTKLLRQLLDLVAKIPNSLQVQKSLVSELVEWAGNENKLFLKLYLETRSVSLDFQAGNYQEALSLIQRLLKELRRLDDKMMLLEVHLLESKIQFAIGNVPKTKASLTASRTYANSIYCPPLVQAALDLQSGVVLAHEKDFKTAFSYFQETFEGLANASDDKQAALALKYMLLCKIMMGSPGDVPKIAHGKMGTKYSGASIDAMLAVAKAYANRSVKEFEATLSTYYLELNQDNIVKLHLVNLYQSLLEKNLLKLIEPYSRVELDYLCQLIELPLKVVEAKLSQMILDKCFSGMLDQGSSCLIILDDYTIDPSYQAMISTLKQMDHIVDSLYQKAAILNT